MYLYKEAIFRKDIPTELHELVACDKGETPLKEKCTQKRVEELCLSYTRETGSTFTTYYDAKFLEWLEKSNLTQEDDKQNFYTFIESSKFAQAIMDAYMTSMNEVSKKLDNQVSQQSYSKEEVLEIVFEAFNSAKTIGESQIQNSK